MMVLPEWVSAVTHHFMDNSMKQKLPKRVKVKLNDFRMDYVKNSFMWFWVNNNTILILSDSK